VTLRPAAKRQIHSAAPHPARCINSSTELPRAISAASALRICAAVRIWSGLPGTGLGRNHKPVLSKDHLESALLERRFRLIRAVGREQLLTVLAYLEAVKSACRQAHNDDLRALGHAALDRAIGLELERTAERAGDTFALRLLGHTALAASGKQKGGGDAKAERGLRQAQAERRWGKIRSHFNRSCETSRTAPRAALVVIAA
jgi:hypothetical protein